MAEENAIERELLSLQQDYLQSLPAKLDHLSALHRTLIEGAGTEEVLNDYVFVVHKLAGSAALYGLEDVSELAKQLEHLLLSIHRLPDDLPDERLAHLNTLLNALLEAAPPKE